MLNKIIKILTGGECLPAEMPLDNPNGAAAFSASPENPWQDVCDQCRNFSCILNIDNPDNYLLYDDGLFLCSFCRNQFAPSVTFHPSHACFPDQ